jgi:DNA-binding NtrC family response regulator
VKEQHQAWLQVGRRSADVMLRERTPYIDGVSTLTFFYARKMVALCNGNLKEAGRAAGVAGNTMGVAVRLRAVRMNEAAEREAEQWGTHMAIDGATYREAVFVFGRALLEQALERSGGSRSEAARQLNVHRNVFSRMPDEPGRMRPHTRAG